MNFVKRALALSAIIFVVACEVESKFETYNKDGVSLTLVEGWTFTGDTDFYWAADRAVSAETKAFSTLSLLIYQKEKIDLNSVSQEMIVGKVLPRYIREIEERKVIKQEIADIVYGSHKGVRLTYVSPIDIAEVFLFELKVENGKVFVLFITDKEDFGFVESTIGKVLSGITVTL